MKIYRQLTSHRPLFKTPVVNSSFSPTDIAGLQQWFKADVGTYYDGAVQLTAASNQTLSIADNASLSMGAGVRCTIAGWVYLDSTGEHALVGKYNAAISSQEYLVETSTTTRLRFFVNPTGAAADVSVSANTFGALLTGTWYFFCAYYDGVNIGISVNNGVFDTVAYSSDIFDGTSAFILGNLAFPAVIPHNGRLDSVGVWKRVLTGAEITAIYNAGNGVTFSDLTAANKVSLSAWYDFQTTGSGLVTDSSVNGNTLTNNNAATLISGIAAGASSANGDPVGLWVDQSGNARNGTQTIIASRPTYRTAVKNGMPIIRFDGINDSLAHPFNYTGSVVTIFIVAQRTGTPAPEGPLHEAQQANSGANLFPLLARPNSNANWGSYFNAYVISSYTMASTWRVVCLRVRSGTDLDLITDNNPPEVKVGSGYYTDSNERRIIGGCPSTGEFFQGDIGEIIFYDSVLSATNLANVQNYLNARWAIF